MNLAFSEIYKVSTNGKGLGFFDLKKNQPTKNLPHFKGVYVWGFKFDDGKGGIGPFMPYYVGQAGGGKQGSESEIYRRLKSHYDFKPGNYHVIKSKQLHKFGTFLKTDEEIDQIAKVCNNQIKLNPQDKKVFDNSRNQLFDEYSENFDYLNKEINPSDTKYVALDQLHAEREKNADSDLNKSIKFYQANFYACWIRYDGKDSNNDTKESEKEKIEKLEKYIQILVKSYKGQKLIGRDETKKNSKKPDWSLNSLIEQFGEINTRSLGSDCFI